ncbi:hypothetical protein [Streptomyces lydicus]|uniref:hypothetical protein n=1 Tax=Streptomyces lydicus TaxID=47763 RepID=UPI0037959614
MGLCPHRIQPLEHRLYDGNEVVVVDESAERLRHVMSASSDVPGAYEFELRQGAPEGLPRVAHIRRDVMALARAEVFHMVGIVQKLGPGIAALFAAPLFGLLLGVGAGAVEGGLVDGFGLGMPGVSGGLGSFNRGLGGLGGGTGLQEDGGSSSLPPLSAKGQRVVGDLVDEPPFVGPASLLQLATPG